MKIPESISGKGGVLFTLTMILFLCANIHAKQFPNIDYVDWNHDSNPRNRFDDRLEAMAPSQIVDAVVLFNHCPLDLVPYDSVWVDSFATVDYIGDYVQGIWVKNATVDTLWKMLQHPYGDAEIFRIEWADTLWPVLDVSCPAVKARQSGTYSPNTAWDQGYTGGGVRIAIIDSGVDDGHPAITGRYAAGFDATANPRVPVNPDDNLLSSFHGTHCAGIALGNDPNGTYMGVAPHANLVDVKVIGSNGFATQADFAAGINWCIGARHTCNIKVLSLSLGGGSGVCNGKCVMSMLIDAAVDKGLVCCVAAGNNGQTGYITCPGTADRAITVGALDDQGTISRNDETLAAFSNQGPRTSDNDNDTIDEEKPDVVAPGVAINSCLGSSTGQTPANVYQNLSGTSMATPHVAGLAALMIGMDPSLTPDGIKAIIRRNSTDAAQNLNPAWTSSWGKGEIDCYNATLTGGPTDLYINSWIQEVYTVPATPKVGVPTPLNAIVHNAGPNNALNVDVLFFTNKNNLGYSGWVQIGQTTLVNIPSGSNATATVTWTPLQGHQCIRAQAVYISDTNRNNNVGQDNFDPKPSTFFAEAGSPFTGPQMYNLVIDATDLMVEEGWDALVYSEEELFPPVYIAERAVFETWFELCCDRCPKIIYTDINHPPGTPPGTGCQIVLEGWVQGQMVGRQTFYSYEPFPQDSCLSCDVITHTPGVPVPGGRVMWDLTATNCGNLPLPVWAELFPTIGDCATGTPISLNMTKEITPNLEPGEVFTGNYYMDITQSYSFSQVACNFSVGPEIDEWLGSCCFDFTFYHPWGRTGSSGIWSGEWMDRPDDMLVIPLKTALGENYPNPFNSSTEIPFELARAGEVKIRVYNINGQLVDTVFDGILQPGWHSAKWNADRFSSGVYFYKLKAGDKTIVKSMTLIK
ncbi:MAG: S8 family serine peptidase [candidate division Zixibacteria bacterium]|nr:S8 family serine peptidase [candidate division Zixibacteria bacterium]